MPPTAVNLMLRVINIAFAVGLAAACWLCFQYGLIAGSVTRVFLAIYLVSAPTHAHAPAPTRACFLPSAW
jgi:hypothetical protein